MRIGGATAPLAFEIRISVRHEGSTPLNRSPFARPESCLPRSIQTLAHAIKDGVEIVELGVLGTEWIVVLGMRAPGFPVP